MEDDAQLAFKARARALLTAELLDRACPIQARETAASRAAQSLAHLAAITAENVVVHDRAQQVGERAAGENVLPPDHFRLERFEPGQRKPADRTRVHARNGRRGETRERQVIHDGLEGPGALRAQLSRNGETSG